MNRQSTSRQSIDLGLRGFTLLELLVAMAVLALVLILMLQVTASIMGSTRTQNQQMDSVATARRALDVMIGDLRHAVINDSRTIRVPDNTNSPSLFTLDANRRGPSGETDHRFLIIEYQLDSDGKLTRHYASESFSDPPPSLPANGVELASGLLGFQARVLTENGHSELAAGPQAANWSTNEYNGKSADAGQKALVFRGPSFSKNLTNRAVALELWIAAADPQTTDLLKSAGKWSTVVDTLQEADHPKEWRQRIDSLPDVPGPTKSAIRVLNKTIALP